MYAKDRVEIKWKFKDDLGELGKVEKDRIFGGEYGKWGGIIKINIFRFTAVGDRVFRGGWTYGLFIQVGS